MTTSTPVPLEKVFFADGSADGDSAAVSEAAGDALADGTALTTSFVLMFEITTCPIPTTNSETTEINTRTFHETLRASAGNRITLFSISKSLIERVSPPCSSS